MLTNPLNISQLATLIKDSSCVIANDTGPAHMAAHLNVKGLTLFGKHTTAFKVSIERENFKVIEVTDLNKLSVDKVFEKRFNNKSKMNYKVLYHIIISIFYYFFLSIIK